MSQESMAAKKRAGAGGFPPARPVIEASEPAAKPAGENAGLEPPPENTPQENMRKETNVTPSHGLRTETPLEGVTVIGEAVRRVHAEKAEFLIEVTTSATTAAQALRDNQAKTAQITQAVGPLGVQQADIQTISTKVQNFYSPVLPSLPAYGSVPQLGQAGLAQGFSPYAMGPAVQPEPQFGSYQAINVLRIHVREPARVGDIAEAAARAGASIPGAFWFRPADEAHARRAALEAAGKDARSKAEALATAAGKQLGEPQAILEDMVASNGSYSALRANMPFLLGAGAPEFVGELEYYARVSASSSRVSARSRRGLGW
jgi:uncharacterized protein YggE